MKHKQNSKQDIFFLSPIFKRYFVITARIAFFVIFFWFGFLKLIGISPASPLAEALTAKTVGIEYFDLLFIVLAGFECLIGILFLFPKADRISVCLLFVHMGIVCSPLILVPELTWQKFGVPTLEGQYIIKNIALIALAMGLYIHSDRSLKKT